MAEISIIVPVYNVERYISRCLDSILAQTYSNFDVILIDDGSTDNSGKICDEYAKLDSRVNVIHQHYQGVSVARNIGLEWIFKNSDSQWFTFIDSDDWVNSKYLENLFNACIENDVDISVCGFVRTKGEETLISESACDFQMLATDKFFMEHNVNAILAWGKLYKKDLFKDIRYPVGKIHEDEFTTHKVLFKLDKIVFIDAPLYNYFVNPSGIMKSYWTPKKLDVLCAMKNRITFFKKNNMVSLYEWQVRLYLHFLNEQYHSVLSFCKDEKQKKKYIRKIRRLLGVAIVKYKKYYKAYNRLHKGVYEMAFPKTMYIYWILVAMKNKLKGR